MNDKELKLSVSHDFSCSKEALFYAWTDPEQLKQWWQPLGKHLVNVNNDIREGGEVKYEFENNTLTI